MLNQSNKIKLWFIEKIPDFYMWIVIISALIIITSSVKLFFQLQRKSSKITFSAKTWEKWTLLATSMVLLILLIALGIYRLEKFYGITPFFASFVWKLNLFTSFVMILTIGLWIFKGTMNNMFINYKRSILQWSIVDRVFKRAAKKETEQKHDKKKSQVKTNKTLDLKLMAASEGIIKDIAHVKDEVFSKKLLGEGIAIESQDGQIYAPINGVVESVFPTKHAYGIRSGQLAILIHIGIDTVALKGKGFKSYVKANETVKQGQLIASVDLKVLAEHNKIADILVLVLPESQVKTKLLRKTGHVTLKTNVIHVS